MCADVVPACTNCGGEDFYADSGFYICQECQFQSQDVFMRNFGEEQYELGHKATTVSQTGGRRSQKSSQESQIEGTPVTSWELVNEVLVGLVNELVELTGVQELKPITFQLWVAYLRSIGVAFTSTTSCKRPRLGLAFKASDAQLLYGATKVNMKAYKRTYSDKSYHSITKKRPKAVIKGNKMKKSLFTKTAKSQYSASNVSEISFNSAPSSVKEKPLSGMKWDRVAAKELNCLLDIPAEKRTSAAKSRRAYYSHDIRHVTVLRAVAVLRLGMLLASNKILFSDLLRWDEEGYFSLSRLSRLVPKDIYVSPDLTVLLQQEIKSQSQVAFYSVQIGKKLGLQKTKVDFINVCQRIIRKLHLPEETVKICRAFVHMVPPKQSLLDNLLAEVKASALILFIMKFLFGLDDRTEYYTSEAVQLINSSQGTNIFVWSEWEKYLELKWANEAQFEPSPKRYPGCGDIEVFLDHWRPAQKSHFNCMNSAEKHFHKQLDEFLEPLSYLGREPKGPTPFEPTEPLNNDSITIFYDYEKMQEIALKSGVKVEKGCARRKVTVKHSILSSMSTSASTMKELVPVKIGSPPDDNYYTDNLSTKFSQLMTACSLDKSGDVESSDSCDESTSQSDPDNQNLARKVEPWNPGPLPAVLHLAGSDVSFYHLLAADSSQLSNEDMDELARLRLPNSVFWLLTELSRTSRVPLKKVYFQLIKMEKAFLFYLKTNKKKPW